MADERHPEPADPHVRVVDRRWWAREEGVEPSGGEARKPSYVEDLERQLADQGAQLQAIQLQQRTALDEFEQVKLRIRRDVAREVERGKRAVLTELLEVLDNLDRAVAAALGSEQRSDAVETLTRGVALVRDQFLAKLAALGVTRIKALDQPFDAALHEAVTTTPVASAEADGTIVAVVKEGYAIGDEILRPASVVVGKYE